MSAPSRDPSIEHEPHLGDATRGWAGSKHAICNATTDHAATENSAERSELQQDIDPLATAARSEDERVEHSVWEEPAITAWGWRPIKEDATNFPTWFEKRSSQTSELWSWTIVLLVALAAGPWAVIGALMAAGVESWMFLGVLGPVVLAPVSEEVLKIAVALFVTEKRPYLFRSGVQILLCAAAGGLMFAVIENLIYLNVYIPNPSEAMIAWRWRVCTMLHVCCSLIAGVGLLRMWRRTVAEKTRPQPGLAWPFLLMAMIVHGAYNALAVALDALEMF